MLAAYAYTNTSASIAKMVEMGLLANIGAHGEPPLGLNYHAEMFFTKQGGLDNYEVRPMCGLALGSSQRVWQVLRAATISGATTLGLQGSLGSLSEGKLADFLIYPPDVDLLNGHIWQTLNIKYVVRGGRVWNAETMAEVWPEKGKVQHMPPINPD